MKEQQQKIAVSLYMGIKSETMFSAEKKTNDQPFQCYNIDIHCFQATTSILLIHATILLLKLTFN